MGRLPDGSAPQSGTGLRNTVWGRLPDDVTRSPRARRWHAGGMLFIFGFKNSSRNLGLAQAVCPRCGRRAAQRVDRRKRAFSVFFIPIVPLGSSYEATCTACGVSTGISRTQAEGILAGAY